jgi:hypothetical protein
MQANLYCRHASDVEAISSKEQQLAWFAQAADRYLCHNQRLSRCRAVAKAVRGFALKPAVGVRLLRSSDGRWGPYREPIEVARWDVEGIEDAQAVLQIGLRLMQPVGGTIQLTIVAAAAEMAVGAAAGPPPKARQDETHRPRRSQKSPADGRAGKGIRPAIKPGAV